MSDLERAYAAAQKEFNREATAWVDSYYATRAVVDEFLAELDILPEELPNMVKLDDADLEPLRGLTGHAWDDETLRNALANCFGQGPDWSVIDEGVIEEGGSR